MLQKLATNGMQLMRDAKRTTFQNVLPARHLAIKRGAPQKQSEAIALCKKEPIVLPVCFREKRRSERTWFLAEPKKKSRKKLNRIDFFHKFSVGKQMRERQGAFLIRATM